MAKMFPTQFKGVRYREHETRKNGIRPDKYFYIRYRIGKKLREDGWGWESEGFAAKDAFIERERIMRAIKTGDEVVTLADRRAEAQCKREEKAAAAESYRVAGITFGQFFNETYVPHKDKKAVRPELSLYKMWLEPVIGNKPFAKISEFDLERIKKQAVSNGKALRTVQYCFAVVRQVFSEAHRHGVYKGEHPVSKNVRRRIRFDNKKLGYLTSDEANALLEALAVKSQQLHDMATLSLYCGLRAGEIFSLDWCDVHLSDRTLTLRDTKNSKTRMVIMPDQALKLFAGYSIGEGNKPVFVNTKGERIGQVSKTFERVVDTLGLNKDIDDRRYKVTFHTLRHTFASWLASGGIPLYTIQKLLGHSTIQMTERYAHLCPGHLDQVANVLSLMAEVTSDNIVMASTATG